MCDAHKNPPRRSILWSPSLYQMEPDETVSPQYLDSRVTLFGVKQKRPMSWETQGPLSRRRGATHRLTANRTGRYHALIVPVNTKPLSLLTISNHGRAVGEGVS